MDPLDVFKETVPYLTTASGADVTRMFEAALPAELHQKIIKPASASGINWAEAAKGLGIASRIDESRISELDPAAKGALAAIVIAAFEKRLELLNKDAQLEVFQSKWSFMVHCAFLILSLAAILAAIVGVFLGKLEAGVVTTVCGGLSGWLSQGPFKFYTEAKKRENSSLRDIELIQQGLRKLGLEAKS